jgi:disease resistance protein
LSIKGCRELDSHSSEKQVVLPQTTIKTSTKEEKDVALGVEKCPRCSNGFACEMHPEESKKNEEKMRRVKELKEQKKREEELERAKMDPNALQTCKRTGCGMKFRESENKNECCRYHKGKPIFHERSKGWSCCASGKKAVYDFDEFLKIPPCAVGRHSAVVEEEEEGEEE